MFPGLCFSMPLKPPAVALGRSKIAFTRQTGQARDLQSNLSSMAPRSQGCKRCSGVDTVRQLFLCLDILSLGTQFYWKKIFLVERRHGSKFKAKETFCSSSGTAFYNKTMFLEYPSLTPYRDWYMRYSIKCFRSFEMSLHPQLSVVKRPPLLTFICWMRPFLSLSRGIVAWGAAS